MPHAGGCLTARSHPRRSDAVPRHTAAAQDFADQDGNRKHGGVAADDGTGGSDGGGALVGGEDPNDGDGSAVAKELAPQRLGDRADRYEHGDDAGEHHGSGSFARPTARVEAATEVIELLDRCRCFRP